MKDDRTFRQRMQEADGLIREAREKSEDELLIQKIRSAPTWQELLEQKLHPDIENSLPKKCISNVQIRLPTVKTTKRIFVAFAGG